MFRIRRLVLKLTVAAAVLPLAFWAIVIFTPTFFESLGTSGRAIGSHLFLRYIEDSKTVQLYRDGYPIVVVENSESQAASFLALYGLLALILGSIEGFIRLIESHKRRAGGFEVIEVQPVAVAGPAIPAGNVTPQDLQSSRR